VNGPRPYHSIAIVGLGLMGGSLARALKALPAAPRILAFSTDADALERARAEGVADETSSVAAEIIRGADMVVYATPVSVTVGLLGDHAHWLRAARVVTDLGSVKAPVLAAARAAKLESVFVGAHPMCGRERSGFAAADARLFHDATVWLVPAGASSPVDPMLAFWRELGAAPRITDEDTHDRLVAAASHLPQVLSSTLAAVLHECGVSRESLGPGGRDMTRLARSPAELWMDILLQNRRQLLPPLEAMIDRLEAFGAAVRRGDGDAIRRALEDGRGWAEPG
jgi:prephenate dehydrogenase